MMTRIFHALLTGVFLLSYTSSSLTAQEDVTTYFVVDYMKVKPENQAQYVQLEKAWKKIHEARIKAGNLKGWYFDQVVSPAGTNQEYNFITVNSYAGEKMLAGHYENAMVPSNWQELVSFQEAQLMQRTGELRDIVKTEVYAGVDGAWADDRSDARVMVFNFFKNREGVSNADHAKMESELWKPVHEARIKDGKMKGWGLYNLVLPRAYTTMTPYHSATIDLYEDMEQLLAPPALQDYFEKVHPDKDVDALLTKMWDSVDLLRAEVRMRRDHVYAGDNGDIVSLDN